MILSNKLLWSDLIATCEKYFYGSENFQDLLGDIIIFLAVIKI